MGYSMAALNAGSSPKTTGDRRFPFFGRPPPVVRRARQHQAKGRSTVDRYPRTRLSLLGE
jgi:hypothetical protein